MWEQVHLGSDWDLLTGLVSAYRERAIAQQYLTKEETQLGLGFKSYQKHFTAKGYFCGFFS